MDLINAKELYQKVSSTLTRLRVLATLDPESLADLFATTPVETVIAATAGTKNIHFFSSEVRKFRIKTEKCSRIDYSFYEARFDANQFQVITSGGELKESGLFLNMKAIYFKSEIDATIEILEWY